MKKEEREIYAGLISLMIFTIIAMFVFVFVVTHII